MNKYIWIIALVIFSFHHSVYAARTCYYIADETGNIVYVTGWKVRVGDEFLTADNKRYEILSISGDQVKARLIGQMNVALYWPQLGPDNKFSGFWNRAYAAEQKKIAVYHTHNDEAYVPSDGTESVDNGDGGIMKVGTAFATALENNGLQAIHSEENHIPHDDMAYQRSRRTVVKLLKEQPDAIFDIHRDATPPEAYQGQVDGQKVTKVQFVVGKYGPTSKQAEEYALQMKAVADEKHAGLVKGIFFAKGGDYNQDLHPKAMLVEVGAHTNTREEAELGVAMLADVMPSVLGVTSANDSNINGSTGVGTTQSGPSGSVKSIAWIIGFLIVGSVIFLFLSTGGIKEMKAKYKNFTTREFRDFFGFIHHKKK